MNYNDSLKLFFEEYPLQHPKSKSEQTLRFHGENLRDYGRFLKENLPHRFADVTQITAEDLDAYRRALVLDKRKDNTIKGRVKSVRMFVQVLAQAKVMNNVADKFTHSCEEEEQIIPFSDEEVSRMLKSLNPAKKSELRLLAFIHVLLDTGLRLKEIISLNINDLNLRDKTLFIRNPKGRVMRTVYFGQETKKLLLRYLKEYQLSPDDIKEPLFQTLDGRRRWDRRTIQDNLRELGKKAGLTSSCHAHKFRHTLAINSIRAGMNPVVLQKLMGHKDLKTTMIYVNLTNDMVKNGYISNVDIRQTPDWDKAVVVPRPPKPYYVV